jgi:hypothetical protein
MPSKDWDWGVLSSNPSFSVVAEILETPHLPWRHAQLSPPFKTRHKNRLKEPASGLELSLPEQKQKYHHPRPGKVAAHIFRGSELFNEKFINIYK